MTNGNATDTNGANGTGRKFAVVTGASSGIGYELAAQFARNGFDVLVVAEDEGIRSAAQRLSSTGANIEPLQADLATWEGNEAVYQKIQASNRPLDAIALNAGVGVAGPFEETDLARHLNLVELNIVSPVHLTHRVLKDMVARGQGRILFTSSIAATMPGPFNSTYNASKAFLKSFSEAIRSEVKDKGITVTALMPGPTETNFFERAGNTDTKLGQSNKDSAEEVAKEGFDALMSGDDHVVAGSFKNKVQATVAHVLPDTATAQLHYKEAKPGSGKE
jgi:short-subunit dehydrogenase